MTGPPVERVFAYFDSNEKFEVAVKALASYFSPRLCYTGSQFDVLGGASPADRYTPTDFLAVSTLSVEIPARAALALLDNPNVVPAETAIPRTASLWTSPDLLDSGGDAWLWWDAVDGLRGLGRTKTSKLLAVKRPHLVPVYDAYVDEALRMGDSYWGFWQQVARSRMAPELIDRVRSVARVAAVPELVSILRIIDVVVWMRQHGWSTHDGKQCRTCNLDDVRPLRP